MANGFETGLNPLLPFNPGNKQWCIGCWGRTKSEGSVSPLIRLTSTDRESSPKKVSKVFKGFVMDVSADL